MPVSIARSFRILSLVVPLLVLSSCGPDKGTGTEAQKPAARNKDALDYFRDQLSQEKAKKPAPLPK